MKHNASKINKLNKFMAEIVNSNVFVDKKFVDFAGLDYFWEKAKSYVDGVDSGLSSKIASLETTVNGTDEVEGLVKKVADLRTEVNALGGTEGGIQGMIDSTIAGLDLPNTYDAKGSAEAAEAAAKSYVDGIVNDKEVDGETVKGLNSRIADLEAIDHEQLASDASAAAVATVLDGAPEKFDTLKEIAQWISDSESAATAADLVNRVKALEDIDHEAYIDYTDEAVKGLKENEIKTNTDAIAVLNGTEEGSVAKAVADGVAGANSYADGVAATAESNANAYTDGLYNSIQFASTTDIDRLFV